MNTAVAIDCWQSEQDRASEDWKGMDQAVAAILARWLRIGKVLIKGKIAENRPKVGVDAKGRPKYQLFSEWTNSLFPKMSDTTRVDAIWFVHFFNSNCDYSGFHTNPTNIRAWAEEQKNIRENTDPVLRDAPAPEAKIVLDKSVGKRIVQLHHRTKTNDEGSPIADKAIKAYAKRHGVTEDDLIDAAKNAAPDEFFRFSPPVQRQLDTFRANLVTSIEQMKASGIPAEAIRAIYLQLATTV